MTKEILDVVRRIGKDFEKEMIDVDKQREENNLKKISMGKKTNMITKHTLWKKIKEDLSNLILNKKGLATMEIFLFILIIFVAIVFLGIGIFIFNTISDNLDIDTEFGQVNLKDANQATLGKLNLGLLNSADTIGFTIIFGMILAMLTNAFLLRGEFPKLFIIVDIIILVFAYILSIYIADAYSLLINSTSLLNVYTTSMQKTSTFILNLPKFVGIIGAFIIILSYSGIPKESKEAVFSG